MAEPAAQYRIRPARPAGIGRLREIEDEASTMFDGLGLIDDVLDVSFPLDELRRLVDAGQVWVAADAIDRPVGMVIVSVRDHVAYVEEMDVLPEHGGRTRRACWCCTWVSARRSTACSLASRPTPCAAPTRTGTRSG
jgi:hypothetical protein